jgi:endoglucanase
MMKLRLTLLLITLITFGIQAQTVIYQDQFDQGILSTGSAPNGFALSLNANNFRLVGNGASGLYPQTIYNAHMAGVKKSINCTSSQKIYIKAKSDANCNFRIDFIDELGYSSNKAPIEKGLSTSYGVYEFDYTNNMFDGAFGGPCKVSGCKVDAAKIAGFIIYINGNSGGFKGTIDVDWISIGAPLETITPGSAPIDIKYNQVTYLQGRSKLISISSRATFLPKDFEIRNKTTNEIVFTGKTGASKLWSYSNEYITTLDVSNINKVGEYVIKVDDMSKEFTVSEKGYGKISKAAWKYYYLNRASIAIEEKFAGIFKRPLGHADTNVRIHSSAATTKRPTGTVIQSPKGWYDAGDYNKYIVNSGISTFALLSAYEHYPTYYDTLKLNLPESENKIPDILDEAKWNIDWMLTMQDPDDGGVYHKCTDLTFSGQVMPHNSNLQRYVVQKTTAATLNFAAVMAMSARIFKKYEAEYPGYSEKCRLAAISAFKWSKFNPTIYYKQPSDVQTGEYGDGDVKDEFVWAASELFITTNDLIYTFDIRVTTIGGGVPAWPYVSPLAAISLSLYEQELKPLYDVSNAKNSIIATANGLRNTVNSSAFGVAMGNQAGDFVWGSNGQAGNQIVLLIKAFELTNDKTYLDAAYKSMDYLLGRNATGYCFMTGFGVKSVLRPHHRPSQADGIGAPVPGMLAGGPHNGQQDRCGGYPDSNPATSYQDTWCSYSTNEVTINWNAPTAYALNALDFYQEKSLSTSAKDVEGKSDELNIYPSPSTNVIYFKSINDFNYKSYEIFGLDGKSVLKGNIESNSVDVSNLSNGLHILKLKSNNNSVIGKFIKN